MADPWYPPAEDYYVPSQDEHEYPVRQGDVFGLPSGLDEGPDAWLGCMVVHPSCEVQTGKPVLQVARIHAVSELEDGFQQALVTYGLRERDGDVLVAFANTFWLPPAQEMGPLSGPMFADFRETRCIARENMEQGRRVRAMAHEARVYLIRRKIYFRYRWKLPIDDVRRMEADRIRSDMRFHGPRPEWAT